MTDKLLIERELLERLGDFLQYCAERKPYPAKAYPLRSELRAILAAPRQPEGDDLDQRMKAAGMLSVAELLAGAPLDAFMKHAGVNDLATFTEWLAMRRAECIRMHARYDLGERDKGDDLYEWTIAHAAVFNEVHINFKAAHADARRAIAELESARDAAYQTIEKLCADYKPVFAERDTLRQQLADRDAEIEEWSGTAVQNGMECDSLRQQRDKLAGLLREVRGYTDSPHIVGIIDAALAEVNK